MRIYIKCHFSPAFKATAKLLCSNCFKLLLLSTEQSFIILTLHYAFIVLKFRPS